MHKEIIFILKEEKRKIMQSCNKYKIWPFSTKSSSSTDLDMFKTVLTSHFFCYLVKLAVTTYSGTVRRVKLEFLASWPSFPTAGGLSPIGTSLCEESEIGVLGILALLPHCWGPLPHLPYDATVGPTILQLKSWLASVTLARWTGTMLKQIEAALRHFPLEFVFS